MDWVRSSHSYVREGENSPRVLLFFLFQKVIDPNGSSF
ncbi:hypothetical protein LEP1GSC199_1063 [Leptospira vanthielii serovar Holland str. Waz Holland = ATCC 700522]|uniref:Uncharacterized protein n=1 Tax=Leptospira vanthielii serovar Holland str. Waz Holland = ATCC 700522 TaxID=1218591 RepID=N1W9R8_9LEPT|nr:hypothetical protein LEP1GSC199_1063 [Leptospira vanthielii serovar Holland str. Waz Holland = ATCC 700522]